MPGAPKTLDVTQIHALLDALLCKNGTKKQFRRGVRNYTMACLMLEAGLRVGEVVKLKWSHLWFNCLPVTSIIISPEIAKNKKERQIPVSTRLSEAIKTIAELYWFPSVGFADLYVFCQIDSNNPLTTRQVERIIRKAAMKSLGRPIHPHVLRHTFADRLRKVTDLRTVQELLGHDSITSTQIYTHPNNDDKKKAIDQVDDRDTVYT